MNQAEQCKTCNDWQPDINACYYYGELSWFDVILMNGGCKKFRERKYWRGREP